MKNEFDAIVFDMDGTLVDTEVVWHEAETKLVTARGKVYTLEARSTLIGLRIDEGLARLKDYYGFSDDVSVLVDELNESMMELVSTGENIRIIPGIPELVQYVVDNNIPRAIASAAPGPLIELVVDKLGWHDVFTIRCAADQEAFGKPAPDVYLTAARRLGADPTRCLAIEDTVNGAKAAVAAGMTCFVVPDPKYVTRAAFDGITPHLFDSMFDVLERLRA